MPKKLKLNIDELHVEQFRIQPSEGLSRGTVRGFTYPGGDCTLPSDVYRSECVLCAEGYITQVGCE